MLALSSHHSTSNLAIIDRGNGSYERMDTRQNPNFHDGAGSLGRFLGARDLRSRVSGCRRHLLRCGDECSAAARRGTVRRRPRPGNALAGGDHRRRCPDRRSNLEPGLQTRRLRWPATQPCRGDREHGAAAVHDEPVGPDRRHRGQHRRGPRNQHVAPGRPGDGRRAIHRRLRASERSVDGPAAQETAT